MYNDVECIYKFDRGNLMGNMMVIYYVYIVKQYL